MTRDKQEIKKEKISISLDPYTVEKIDYLVKKLKMNSRTSFIEKAIFYYALHLEKEISKKKLEEFELKY